MIAYLIRSAIFLVAYQNISQNKLQGLQFGTSQVNQSIKVGIPLSNRRPQRDYRDYRLGKGKNDFEEEIQVAAAVNLGGFP